MPNRFKRSVALFLVVALLTNDFHSSQAYVAPPIGLKAVNQQALAPQTYSSLRKIVMSRVGRGRWQQTLAQYRRDFQRRSERDSPAAVFEVIYSAFPASEVLRGITSTSVRRVKDHEGQPLRFLSLATLEKHLDFLSSLKLLQRVHHEGHTHYSVSHNVGGYFNEIVENLRTLEKLFPDNAMVIRKSIVSAATGTMDLYDGFDLLPTADQVPSGFQRLSSRDRERYAGAIAKSLDDEHPSYPDLIQDLLLELPLTTQTLFAGVFASIVKTLVIQKKIAEGNAHDRRLGHPYEERYTTYYWTENPLASFLAFCFFLMNESREGRPVPQDWLQSFETVLVRYSHERQAPDYPRLRLNLPFIVSLCSSPFIHSPLEESMLTALTEGLDFWPDPWRREVVRARIHQMGMHFDIYSSVDEGLAKSLFDKTDRYLIGVESPPPSDRLWTAIVKGLQPPHRATLKSWALRIGPGKIWTAVNAIEAKEMKADIPMTAINELFLNFVLLFPFSICFDDIFRDPWTSKHQAELKRFFDLRNRHGDPLVPEDEFDDYFSGSRPAIAKQFDGIRQWLLDLDPSLNRYRLSGAA